MKHSEAKRLMREFTEKYVGKTVLFHSLNNDDKFAYIMIKSFNYFRAFLTSYNALTRAIENAEAHRESNFEHYATFNEFDCMAIAKD